MRIKKIKLINGGITGIEINAIIPKENHDFTVLTEVKQYFYPLPVTADIREKIQRFRKYLLEQFYLWKPEYDKYFVKGKLVDASDSSEIYFELVSLWRNTRIISIQKNEKGYRISGELINQLSHKLSLVSGIISFSDDYKNYNKVDVGWNTIVKLVAEFIETKGIPTIEPKEFLATTFVNSPDILEQVSTLSESEQLDFIQKYLEEKGCIVLRADDFEKNDTTETVVDVENNDIPESNVPDEVSETVTNEEKVDVI